ncbi:Dabb family protein [Mumia sp. ZJ1417]|uniref:Dabb family protein n=1 Tax=unclassified Mumia TaxID=2621872 RepID=UPI0014227380|nr:MULTISPECIES: Dabb family protein [unclassified Mumia]QMW65831.1 Dabb family protein [Mumia sp. ZJ1417]
MGFRHVVLFRWADGATAAQQDDALAALVRLGEQIADLGRLTVGRDAGSTPGNADVAVTVDFPDAAAYEAYATNEHHVRVVTEKIRPILAERTAVQHPT